MRITLISCIWIILLQPLLAQVEPAWVSNPHGEYPTDSYLSGIGIGTSPAAAEKMAIASITQFFETSVTASAVSSENESYEQTGNISSSVLKSTFASQIETFSSAKIQFAEVVKTWQNPRTKSYYSLLVIDKTKACEIYQNKISESEELLTIYLNKNANLLQKYAYLCKAAIVSKESVPYYYYYNALAATQFPRLRADYACRELETIMNETAQSICFDVSVKIDTSNIVLNAIKETIQKMGFVYGNSADLQMDITIIPTDSKKMGKQIFAGYAATMSLYYQDQEVFTISEQVQQGDTTLSFAKTRAIKALANSLSLKFKNEFEKYLGQL